MQIKIALIVFILLFLKSYSTAKEQKKVMYIGYLKPYQHTEVKTKLRRDPMQEPSLKIKIDREIIKPKDLDLKGILFNPGEKRAFINSDLYKEGDIVEGYTISKILPDKVIVKKNNIQFELKIE